MRKDPTEFRERFLRWKKGELVYENGLTLPAYEDGKDANNVPSYTPSIDDRELPGYRKYLWELSKARRNAFLKEYGDAAPIKNYYEDFLSNSGGVFNYRRWYNLASPAERKYGLKKGLAHWADADGKTSLHPSFSIESPYSGYKNPYNPKGITGGKWIDDDHYEFSDSQINNNWPINKTLDEFDRSRKQEGSNTYGYYKGGVMLHEPTIIGKMPKYEDGKTPMLDRLEYDDDGTNYIQYRKLFLDKLWSPEELKQLKFDPERDALRAMLVNDHASFNAGTLPGVVIRPPKDSKKVLSEAKEMLPIDKMRHNWYDWIDTMRDFHYPDRNMDPYEYVRRMYNIYNASGKPSVSTTKTPEYAVHNPFNIKGKDRLMYNPLLNRMYLDPDDPGFADEISHAFLSHTDVPFDFSPLPGDWEINGRNGYERPGHMEYTAHSIIQPVLERYLEDQDLNLSIDDMVKIITNIHDNIKDQNNPTKGLDNTLQKYKIKPKK